MESRADSRAYLSLLRCADAAEHVRDAAYLRRRPITEALEEAARRAAIRARLEEALARGRA